MTDEPIERRDEPMLRRVESIGEPDEPTEGPGESIEPVEVVEESGEPIEPVEEPVERIGLPEEGSSAWTVLRTRASRLLRDGELLILPAEGLYGLHATGEAGRRRLIAAKGDRTGKPFIVLLADPADVQRYTSDLPDELIDWIALVWPAPLTLVLPASPLLPAALVREGQIALRCPDSPWLRSVASACDEPLLSTSANRAGAAPPAAVSDLDPVVRRAAALIVDGGRLGGQGSTVARLSRTGGWTVLREGLWQGDGPPIGSSDDPSV